MNTVDTLQWIAIALLFLDALPGALNRVTYWRMRRDVKRYRYPVDANPEQDHGRGGLC